VAQPVDAFNAQIDAVLVHDASDALVGLVAPRLEPVNDRFTPFVAAPN
jgi:hypothetical protein